MIKDKIFISIIIPCYNCENYIVTTLKSILNQDFQSFEIILVDDGSIDNTLNIIKGFVKNNSNNTFKIIKQDNRGVSSARNNGIKYSVGEYIMFLDSDDFLEKNYLKSMYEKAKNNDLDMVFCGFKNVTKTNDVIFNYNKRFRYINTIIDGKEAIKLMLKEKIWICTGSAIFKRKIIINNNIYYTEGCCNGEDQEFHIKAMLNMKRISGIDKNLLNYLKHENSTTLKFDIRKLQVLGSMSRLKKIIRDSINDKETLSLIENKWKKELLNNIYAMTRDELSIEMLYNTLKFSKAFKKNIIKYKMSNKSILEFKIKIDLFILGSNKELFFKIISFKNKIKNILKSNNTFK